VENHEHFVLFRVIIQNVPVVNAEVCDFISHAVSSPAFTVVTLSFHMMVVIAVEAVVVPMVVRSVTTVKIIVMLMTPHSKLMGVMLINLNTFAFIEGVVLLTIVEVEVPAKVDI